MKTDKLLLLVIGLIGVILFAACQPSQAELDAKATQIAADIFATQTAQAPTATPTFTPTPKPTATPTATPTPTFTPTPKPTATRTPTPTPTPGLESVIVTLNDLPAGFEVAPAEQLEQLQSGWENSVGFGYLDESNSQIVMGVIVPYETRSDQASFDTLLPQIDTALATMLSGGSTAKKLSGLNDIGDIRTGATAVNKALNLALRFDVVVFRREKVGALLIVAYPDGDKLTVTTVDLARLLDERIKTYLAGSRAAKPTGSPTKSAPASDKDGSTAAIKALLQELAKPKAQWDRTAIENLVCAAKQGELISKAEVFLNLNAGLGTDWDTASYDFPGVMLEEKSNDGQTAIVLMTGTRGIKTAAGPVAGSSKPLKAAITLVKEGGAWKVCSDFFN